MNSKFKVAVTLFANGSASASQREAEPPGPIAELAVSIADTAAAVLHDSDGEWGAALQQLFEPLIALTPRWSGDGIRLAEFTRSRRRNSGVYYTPDWIVQRVLDWTLERHLLPAARLKQSQPPVAYDPACGSGRFLVQALDRLHAAGLPPGLQSAGSAALAQRGVSALSLVQGRDIDPLAADLCQAALALEQLSRAHRLDDLPQIATGDSLLAVRLPSGRARGSTGPLVVIGNPPFVNAIGRRAPAALTDRYRARYRQVRGAADTAAYFLAHAAELAGPGGSVGLVLPRAILNSPSAEPLRANLPHGLHPELIWAPDEPSAFAGAAVYFCVVVLGPGKGCRFGTDPRAADTSFRAGTIGSSNWWAELCRARYGAAEKITGTTTRLGDVFEVRAGLTASEAYELQGHIVDSRDGAGARLLTTGLIDPGAALWGRRSCRFLKADYQHPRVAETALANPRLARRLRHAGRPKLVIAGLARRLECHLDFTGEYLPSVSTLVVTHPRDDLALLRSLQEELSAPRSAELVYRELGAHALGGGNITIRKSFLLDYPLLDSSADWKSAGGV